jgi:CHAD domain-containing protein
VAPADYINYCLFQATARIPFVHFSVPEGLGDWAYEPLGSGEWKESLSLAALFVIGDRFPQVDVLGALSEEFSLVWGAPEAGRSTYFDTFDWRLFRADLQLSARRRGSSVELTLDGPGVTPLAGKSRRLPTFGRLLPPGPLRTRIETITRTRRLLTLGHFRWKVERAEVFDQDGTRFASVEFRTGEAIGPSSRQAFPLPATLHPLPARGQGKAAREVSAFLWRSFRLPRTRRRELELVMDALGRTPGLDPSSADITLDPEMEATAAAKIIHNALLSVMRANEAGLLRDLDPEFLHDFRVGIRKTRSGLGQLKGVFPRRDRMHFQREFRWLGDRTGPTRDMDVYLQKIPDYQEALPGGVIDELQPLVDFLERRKRREHNRLTRTLNSKRYDRLMRDWSGFLAQSSPTGLLPGNATRPILDVASERTWKVFGKVLNSGKAAGGDATAEALHRLRINCKRLRYLLSFFRSLFPPEEMKPLLKELKRLQDVLGDFNDIQVQQVSLRQFAEEMMYAGLAPPETFLAMGRLMGQLETQQEIERIAFASQFKTFAGNRNVRRFQRIFRGGNP